MDTVRTKGKVIAIVGSPGCGKTFLASKLAKYYKAETVFEAPEGGYPEQIKDNLGSQRNLFETIVWFRNHQISNYEKALAIANSGRMVVMDAPFYHNQLFVRLYIRSEFEREILYSLGYNDRKLFGYPDCTVYIFSTPEMAKNFIEKRKGTHSWENEAWVSFITQMPPLVEDYMAKLKSKIPNLVEINRGNFDFENESDLNELVNKINLFL